jgi:hypothetical protein
MSILGSWFEWIYLFFEKNVELAIILFYLPLIKKQKVINSHCLLIITFCDFSFLNQLPIYIYLFDMKSKLNLKLANLVVKIFQALPPAILAHQIVNP